jgi:two-component system sensor histidine kinase/response regulator
MPHNRAEVISAIARARADLDRALSHLEVLADDDRQRISYSVHAINNYLMVVATTLELIRSRLVPKGDRDVRRWLDSLKQATSLMMSTARGVLTTAAEGIPPLLFEPASLTEIAEGACRAYGEIARRKRVRIAWKPPARQDAVLTDCVAAGAVLDNLLSNAVKYSAPGTSISITTTLEQNDVVCSVRDHGPGLSESDQAKLFQRGVRLSAQPTGGEASTGYGLAIAFDLAKALGGRLSCTSALGYGSCFTFSLPMAGVAPAIGPSGDSDRRHPDCGDRRRPVPLQFADATPLQETN